MDLRLLRPASTLLLELLPPSAGWRTAEEDFTSRFGETPLCSEYTSDGKSTSPAGRGVEGDSREAYKLAVRFAIRFVVLEEPGFGAEDRVLESEVWLLFREDAGANFWRVLGFWNSLASSAWLVCGRFRLVVEAGWELCLLFLVELIRRK
jgi:hypothetical protein